MTINIEKETDLAFDIDYEKIANEIILASIDYVSCPYEACVNVLLTDDASIKEYNKEYRNIDKATDVLSFPNVDFIVAADFSEVESHPADYFDQETGELILGDIVISIDKVYEQAKAYGHSIEREYAFLIAHSMLHLSGYDHMEEEERVIMEQKQEEILISKGYTRG